MVEEIESPEAKEYREIIQGSHHPGVFLESHWKVCGMITGCGLMQISGLMYASSPGMAEALERLKTRLSLIAGSYPCRTLIGTLGLNHSEASRALLAGMGFKKLTQYRNAAHPMSNDEQELYILTWTAEDIEKAAKEKAKEAAKVAPPPAPAPINKTTIYEGKYVKLWR